MDYCKGIVTDVRQHAGCVEVIVLGPQPGAFAIDNCLVWGIVDAEGGNWIGRAVEYADGAMRFLDEFDEDLTPPAPIPFPRPFCSPHHI